MSGVRYDIVVIGLSLSSSWGNGHATTYRALLQGLATLGHRVLFLERDVPWYAVHRDLPSPGFCDLALYESLDDLQVRFERPITEADAVIVGSYVPNGIAIADLVLATAHGVRSFYDIDTPVTLAGLERGDATYLAPRQIPLLDLYLSFAGGPMLERLASRFGAPRAQTPYCAVDEIAYYPSDPPLRWDLGYLGTYSADRQPALERLLIMPARRLPGGRFVVAGPNYPADIAWPSNVERIEHLPPAEHPDFYCAQRFTLNVTRAAMVEAGWSPSVRLFEAASCGTPIISDRWPGLTDLLPERQAILVADDTDSVVAALLDWPEAARRGIADRAAHIVRASHTGKARARELEGYLAAAAADRLPSRLPPRAAAS
jgi:spore maturation protein CgeB